MAKERRSRKRQTQVVKDCYFCKEKKEPSFSEISILTRFLTERGKIIPRGRNGLCARHQRHLALAIKHARHLALLPFVPRAI